jgi:lipopolysaccharide/colanic/teichoic acid biosynthesis glycosyltransferase/glycosyltransferase involved in cell wall biosynthesis
MSELPRTPLRVLFVTQYFPPETGAAPARALHFVRALRRAGHDVRVVTGLPNHPAGEIRPEYRGVRRRRESFDGAEVDRVWLYATPRKTPLTRLANHLSFALAALPAMLSGRRPDVVLVTTPPLFHGAAALFAARARGAALVNDVRDDWPHAAIMLGEMRPGVVAGALDALARFVQRRAARLLVVTPGMQRRMAARDLEARRLVFLPNGADTELVRPRDPARQRPPGRPFTVLYAGTHGLVHGMESLVEAATLLRDDPVVFRFVGDGVAKEGLQRRAAAAGLTNCVFEPSVTPERLVAVLAEADACVATTRASEFAGETIPVKLFDYLASGCPVLAAVRGDAAAVVAASGGGIVLPPEDGGAMAAAIRALVADPQRCAQLSVAGPAFVEREHSRRALGRRLVEVLDEVVLETRGRPIPARPAGVHSVLKRVLDVALSGLGLLIASPVLLAVAVAIRLDTPGSVLFRQRRVGRGSREFVLLKFRSMAVGTPDLATHLVDPGRVSVTRVGAFIRRTSLDELPQLWNILVGDMTLVGPRPALYNQYDLVAMRQAGGVDALLPGLTGWAQINGRDEIPMETKVALDREYLDRLSPAFDLEILVRTALTLFSMRGVR